MNKKEIAEIKKLFTPSHCDAMWMRKRILRQN